MRTAATIIGPVAHAFTTPRDRAILSLWGHALRTKSAPPILWTVCVITAVPIGCACLLAGAVTFPALCVAYMMWPDRIEAMRRTLLDRLRALLRPDTTPAVSGTESGPTSARTSDPKSDPYVAPPGQNDGVDLVGDVVGWEDDSMMVPLLGVPCPCSGQSDGPITPAHIPPACDGGIEPAASSLGHDMGWISGQKDSHCLDRTIYHGPPMPRGIITYMEIDCPYEDGGGDYPAVWTYWPVDYGPGQGGMAVRTDGVDDTLPSPRECIDWLEKTLRANVEATIRREDRELVDRVRRQDVDRMLSLPDYRGAKGRALLRRHAKAMCRLDRLPGGSRECLAAMIAEAKHPYFDEM